MLLLLPSDEGYLGEKLRNTTAAYMRGIEESTKRRELFAECRVMFRKKENPSALELNEIGTRRVLMFQFGET